MPRPPLIALLVALILAIAETTLHATLFVDSMDTVALSDRADEIVVGTVRATRGEWRDRRIVTVVSVEIEQRIRGTSARTAVIVIPGGKVGDIRAEVIGAPRLAVGDRALFIGRVARREVHVLGLSHGVLPVQPGPGGLPMLHWIPPGSRGYVRAPLETVARTLAIRTPEQKP